MNHSLNSSDKCTQLNVCQQVSSSLPSVITQIVIWRAAYLMLRWYGETAEEEGVTRTNELTAVGDDAGLAIWRRINDAIRHLANMTPPGSVN